MHVLLIIMIFVSLYWLLVGVQKLSGMPYLIAFLFCLAIMVGTLNKKIVVKVYRWIVSHKWVVFLLLFVFQTSILISTKLMIRSDAAIIFNNVIQRGERPGISMYLSIWPNNMFLYYYEWIFYKIFGEGFIWILQFLNILYVNLPLIVFTKTLSKYYSKDISDKFFVLYSLILGFTPQFVAMYTDVMLCPIISVQIYMIVRIIKEQETMDIKTCLKSSILFGLISGLGILVRPTSAILCMAFFMIILVVFRIKKFIYFLSIFCLFVLVVYMPINYLMKNSSLIKFQEGRGCNIFSYIDLGLTETGGDQIDYRDGIDRYADPSTNVDGVDDRWSKEVSIKDIKRRLREYNMVTFTHHIFLKARLTVEDGTLGWAYVDSFPMYFMNPLYEKLENNKLTSFIRNHFINTDSIQYNYYRYYLQIVWCFIVFFFVYSVLFRFKRHRNNRDYVFELLLLAVFGGLLFLMIFEGGKTRYLIQFLPQILIISSIGWESLVKKGFVLDE